MKKREAFTISRKAGGVESKREGTKGTPIETSDSNFVLMNGVQRVFWGGAASGS